jgi:CHAT domain-containing protein
MLSKQAGANVTTLIGDQNRRIDYGEVSAALAQNNFDVLHYAGHATYDELREGHSGLQLAGRDVLTADDLATRNSIPRLVVANACSSAKTGQAGFDDSFMAAQRSRDMVASLLRAGTRAFLGTQWPVDDDAAKTFALSFYEHLLSRDESNNRLPIGEAVRRAREAVVEAHGESCTDWAAYSLYGSPWKPAL